MVTSGPKPALTLIVPDEVRRTGRLLRIGDVTPGLATRDLVTATEQVKAPPSNPSEAQRLEQDAPYSRGRIARAPPAARCAGSRRIALAPHGELPVTLVARLLGRINGIVFGDFVLAWGLVLAAFVLGALAWKPGPRADGLSAHRPTTAHRYRLQRADYFAIGAFAAFLAAYITLTLFFKEDFAYYDDSIFTAFTVRGNDYVRPIWPWEGRFFPFGHQEFNLLKYVTRSAAGYHAFAALELIAFTAALWLLLPGMRLRYRLLVISLALLTPSFTISFGGLIYPERNVLLLMAALVLCARSYVTIPSRWYAVGAIIATHLALYCKEPVFALVLGFVGARIAAGWLSARSHRTLRDFLREHALELTMGALACVFLVFYVAIMWRYWFNSPTQNSYATKMQLAGSPLTTLGRYLRIDPLLGCFLVAVAIRFLRILLRRQVIDLLLDPLAVGALLYASVFMKLRLVAAYYLAPVDFIALLCLAQWAREEWRRSPTVRAAIGIAAALVATVNAAYVAFHLVEKKNVIEGKVQLANFLRNYTAREEHSPVHLYFPYASGYLIMEFSALLQYKGLYPVGVRDGSSPASRLAILAESPQLFEQDRCVAYMPFSCRRAETPPPGALIITLPDDDVPAGALEVIARSSAPIFKYQPVMAPGAMRPLLGRLRWVSPRFSDRQLPETFLQANVFRVRASELAEVAAPGSVP
jgi:hypothetical protein